MSKTLYSSELWLAWGAAILWFAALWLLVTRSIRLILDVKANWIEIPGRMLIAEKKGWIRPFGGKVMQIVKVKYQYSVDGKTHFGSRFSTFDTWKIAYLQSPELIALADAVVRKSMADPRVTVHVDANDAKRARLVTVLPRLDLVMYFLEPTVLALVGTAFLLVAFWRIA